MVYIYCICLEFPIRFTAWLTPSAGRFGRSVTRTKQHVPPEGRFKFHAPIGVDGEPFDRNMQVAERKLQLLQPLASLFPSMPCRLVFLGGRCGNRFLRRDGVFKQRSIRVESRTPREDSDDRAELVRLDGHQTNLLIAVPLRRG